MERKDKEMGRNGKKFVGKEDEGKIKHLRDDRRDKRCQKHTRGMAASQVLSRHLSHTSFPPAYSQVENYTESQKKHVRNLRANNLGSQVIRG